MRWMIPLAVLCAPIATSCTPPEAEERAPVAQADAPVEAAPATDGPTPAGEPIRDAATRLVYVPIYSHIYYSDGRSRINLAATLSVRNTDPERPITLAAVRYYDTEGRLVRRYLERPVRLAPMASTEFVVDERDETGGSGANFLVEWSAGEPVTAPVIEAVMISTRQNLGISFTSEGRELERR